MLRNRLERLSLSQRTAWALGAVVVAASVVSGYIVISIGRLARAADAEVRAVQSLQAATELQMEAVDVMLDLRRYRDRSDPLLLEAMDVSRAAAAQSRDVLRERTTLPEVHDALDRYERLQPIRLAAAQVVIEAVQAGGPPDRLSMALLERERLDEETTALLRGIVELERSDLQRLEATAARSRRAFQRNVLTTIAISMAVIATLLYSIVASGVTRRLTQLTGMAHRVAAGDYSQGHFQEADDEIAVLARAFNGMAGQLAEFDKAKEEFVALAAHQLRTPATAVKATLGMLSEGYCGPLTDEQLDTIRDADASNERQLHVIEDLLFVARTDTGRLVLSKSRVDLARVATEVVGEVRPSALARRQSLDLQVSTAETSVEADEQKMRMVLDNLVGNASKYTPEGGRISVTVGRQNGALEIAVTDSGVGISEEDIFGLFQKFSRIANPLSDTVGGTGLGLYLANEIVKLHGGAIEVASTLGTGSTFTVRLPQEV